MSARRLLLAALAGTLAGIVVYAIHAPLDNAGDLTWALGGARLLRAGGNPYTFTLAGHPLWYPLPAVLLVLPLSYLPDAIAGGVFSGLSFALLAYVLTRANWWRLLVLASPAVFVGLWSVTWTPLLLVLACIPHGAGLAIVKPTLAVPLFLAQPTRRAALIALTITAASLLVRPSWPLEWLHNLGVNVHHVSPLAQRWGALLLLALLRWRDPATRLLLGMAAVPQNWNYADQSLLWAIPQTARQLAAYTAWSWIVYIVAGAGLVPTLVTTIRPSYVLALLYVPALLLILAPKRAVIGRVQSSSPVS